ncbi:MAG: MGMT family protein [Acidimicrobiales bacterium]
MLRKVPLGNTRTDAPVPAPIGSARTFQAVRSACATDAAVLTVTCSHVIRRDGLRGRYGWESAKKGTRLERERNGRDHGDS